MVVTQRGGQITIGRDTFTQIEGGLAPLTPPLTSRKEFVSEFRGLGAKEVIELVITSAQR